MTPFFQFLWMGFNCLKATEPLRGYSFLFTIQFPGFQAFLVLGFLTWDPWIGNSAP